MRRGSRGRRKGEAVSDGTGQPDGLKWIAIAGNVTTGSEAGAREKAIETATLLGRALAVAGYGIIVYSSEVQFMERFVVTGFARSGAAREKSIQVVYPKDEGEIEFPELETHRQLFEIKPDASGTWETSYYESLGKVHGVLLMGGGRSTLIAGLVGIGYGRAVVPIASYGGHANTIWRKLRASGGVLTEPELMLLAAPKWSDEAAARAVGIFAEHAKRLQQRQDALREAELRSAKRTRASAAAAVVLFLFTASLVVTVLMKQEYPGWLLPATFLIAAVAAGISGATVRSLSDLAEHRLEMADQPASMRLALGVIAGVLTALLVAIPQVTAESHLPERLRLTADEKAEMRSDRLTNCLPAAVFAALLAGFATDQFYRKLRDLKLKELELPKE